MKKEVIIGIGLTLLLILVGGIVLCEAYVSVLENVIVPRIVVDSVLENVVILGMQ